MAHKAPGKHYRKGMTLLDVAEMFGDEEKAKAWLAEQTLARWPLLPALRFGERPVEHQAQDHDASLPRLRGQAHVLPQDRNSDGGVQPQVSRVGRSASICSRPTSRAFPA